MKASTFHLTSSFERRMLDLGSASGAAGWRAAQALAHEGATVLLRDHSGRERMRLFEQFVRERGLESLILQLGSHSRGTILDSSTAHHHSAWEPVHIQALQDPVRESGATGEGAHASASVTLVGGGPGDPQLLAVGAVEAVAHADIIFLDRLGIALNVLDMAPGALVLDVGKSPGRHKLAQDRINEEMLHLARAGARIVRLKGGDVFIFGRGGEEWRYLAERGVQVHVIPGITSALSVPAKAGISATHREVTRALTIISGHQPFNSSELQALVALGGTIVILMGVATFASTVAGLLDAGLPRQTGVALLENGYSPGERHTFTTLGDAIADARSRNVRNPAIIVIGDVVSHRAPLNPTDRAIFDEVTG